MTMPDYQCPKCQGHDLKRLEWPNWMIVHWVLNPGLAFNEVVLGQRLPKLMLTCQSCPGTLLERQFVPCPHCGIVHDSRSWSGLHGFGNWLGIVCPECKKRIPCLWNLTSLVVLTLLSPLWYLPYRYYFRNRPAAPPPLRADRPLPQNLAPHFIQAFADGAPPNQPSTAGVVHCTLDLDLQLRVQAMVQNHLNALHRDDINQAAVVILDNSTGAVRALIGSRNFTVGEGQINGALQSRNCGSTLKPFLYLTGLDRRVFTAATLLPDTADAVREAYPGYDPHNFALSHLGPVRVREALANSLNVPAVVALSRIGARRAFVSMKEWGLRFDHSIEEAGAGFILGNVGTRLLDLTNAYAGLARGGLVGPPALVAGPPTQWQRVASPEAVQIITDILCDNDARFRSFGANSSLATPVRVGAKTGTSAEFRDAWAIGFTREHTVGVWVGNFDSHPMGHAASIEAAAPLWRTLIDALLEQDHPVPQPLPPAHADLLFNWPAPMPRQPRCDQRTLPPGHGSQRERRELVRLRWLPAAAAGICELVCLARKHPACCDPARPLQTNHPHPA